MSCRGRHQRRASERAFPTLRRQSDLDWGPIASEWRIKGTLIALIGSIRLMSVLDVVDHLAEGQEALPFLPMGPRPGMPSKPLWPIRPVPRRWMAWVGRCGEWARQGRLLRLGPGNSTYWKAGRVDEAAPLAIWLGYRHPARRGGRWPEVDRTVHRRFIDRIVCHPHPPEQGPSGALSSGEWSVHPMRPTAFGTFKG